MVAIFIIVIKLFSEAAYRAAATYFLLLRQKKVSKEKATLLPAFSCGARLRGAPQNSLRGFAASFKQLRQVRWALLHKSNLRRLTPTPSRGYATAAV